MPRRQRSLATVTPRVPARPPRGSPLERPIRAVDEVDGVQVAVEGRCWQAQARTAARTASAARLVPHEPAGQRALVPQQNFERRWRSRIRSRRASSRARTRSRAASSSGEGTRIGSSRPPACRRASLRASRRSVLIRSPGRLRHQPRRHHLAVDAPLNEVAVEAEAGRARLVAAAHPGQRRSARSTACSS